MPKYEPPLRSEHLDKLGAAAVGFSARGDRLGPSNAYNLIEKYFGVRLTIGATGFGPKFAASATPTLEPV
ncbi:hypothetical protein [Massilia sp. TS11]|uniref:hypothetical protein n=1 Tax=Massilia sp. TS11 TaxID=2908003 RepID=UPI001EDC1661|nr:hypothetical protein [Massilia sp. TS11]MCG2584788.1 hypothetical protein [Massilia sp. TS11]